MAPIRRMRKAPGQLKKAAGAKSARPFAPGQLKGSAPSGPTIIGSRPRQMPNPPSPMTRTAPTRTTVGTAPTRTTVGTPPSGPQRLPAPGRRVVQSKRLGSR